MQVFISHSYGKSTNFGKLLYQWIVNSPIGMTPWASFDINDLPQGGDERGRIIKAAKTADLCICILSKDNLSHHWINFEAGIFYGKRSDTDSVYTILIDGLVHTDLTGGIIKTHPFSTLYHCTLTSKKETLKGLLTTLYLNHSSQDGPLLNIPPKFAGAIDNYIKSSNTKRLLTDTLKLGISL